MWHDFTRRVQRERVFRDRVIALTWLVVGLLTWALGIWPLWSSIQVWANPWGLGSLGVTVLLAVTLVFRATYPVTQLIVGTLLVAADLALGGSLGVIIMYTDVLYSAVRYGALRRLWQVTAVALATTVVGTIAVVLRPPSDPMILLVALQLGVLIIVSVVWGWSVRNERTKTTQELLTQHHQHTRSLRQHVAHDLHDLVANQVAVAGLHIEAAKLQLTRDAPTTEITQSLDRATHGTDRAHTELRSLIGLLMEVDALENDTPRPMAELRELESLLPAGRILLWAGQLDEAKVAELLLREPPTRAQVLLRLLREAMTNAVKHGRGDVTVETSTTQGEDQRTVLHLTITNEVQTSTTAHTGMGLTTSTVLASSIGAEFDVRQIAPGAPWNALVRVPLNGGAP